MYLLLANVLCAQHSATAKATVSATIVSPVGTAKESEFSFGKFTPGNKPGNIVLTPESTIEAYGGVSIVAGNENTPAVFKVFNGIHDYTVTLPYECMMINKDGTQSMQLCQFDILSYPEPGTAGYTEIVAIGATLNIQPNQQPGAYEPAQPFEVVINYN